MAQDTLQPDRQMTLEQFQAFYSERPEPEKWELIEGVPVMMTPPTLVHQRISRNLETALNLQLARVKPEWQADREIGILSSEDPTTNPEPDITVIDTDIAMGQVYAERFYVVAEVLSPSNRPEQRDRADEPALMHSKLEFYRGHAHCMAVLIVEQRHMGAIVHRRVGSEWMATKPMDAEDRIVLPEIGDIGALGELYRHTPLAA